MSASVAWAGSIPNSIGTTVDDPIVLIDGRPSPSVIIYKFVKVDLKNMTSEGDVISINQGSDDVKYGDGKWSQGHFFMRKIIPEGDYLLLESRLGGGMWGIVVTSCFGENAPLFHSENGKINLIDRKILLNFVPPARS